jgi:hypothetical protein
LAYPWLVCGEVRSINFLFARLLGSELLSNNIMSLTPSPGRRSSPKSSLASSSGSKRSNKVPWLSLDCSSSDSDEDEAVFLACLVRSVQAISANRSRVRRGGSKIGRKQNREIGRRAGATNIDSDYFARSPSIASPVFREIDFEQRMRMPRAIFERLRSGLLDNPYFMERRDATGKRGASTDQKMLAAFIQLTDGVSASSTTPYVRLASSTAAECLKEFAYSVCATFESEWLRPPRNEEIAQIEDHYRTLGFPGCLGAVD